MTAMVLVERDLVGILSDSLRLYRRHAGVFVPIALASLPLFVAFQMIVNDQGPLTASQIVVFVACYYVLSVVIRAAIVRAMLDLANGEEPSIARSFVTACHRAPRAIWTRVTTLLLTLASLPLIPFYYTRWLFTTQAVVIHGKSGWDARNYSADRVTDRWWFTFGVVLALEIGSAVWLFFTLVVVDVFSPPELVGIGNAAVQSLAVPYVVIGQTLLYFELDARRKSNEFWASPAR